MAEPGCGGLPYFITGHCISRTLGSIEVEAEPEALSPMLKDRNAGIRWSFHWREISVALLGGSSNRGGLRARG